MAATPILFLLEGVIVMLLNIHILKPRVISYIYVRPVPKGLEEDQILDPDDELDIWCLHLAFLPKNKYVMKRLGGWMDYASSAN